MQQGRATPKLYKVNHVAFNSVSVCWGWLPDLPLRAKHDRIESLIKMGVKLQRTVLLEYHFSLGMMWEFGENQMDKYLLSASSSLLSNKRFDVFKYYKRMRQYSYIRGKLPSYLTSSQMCSEVYAKKWH